MTIAYVGNFTQRHCTEVHIAATLEDLGHTVIRIQENGMQPETLSAMIEHADWGLFLFTRTWGELVTLKHLEQLRERKIPSASYHLDLYIGLERKYLHQGKSLGEVLTNDPFWRTDFVFTPDGDPKSQEIFKQHDVKHYYQRAGVYKPECYLDDERGGGAEVLFVGGGDYLGSPNGYGHPEWPYRDQLIQWLRDTYGDRFVKKGHPQETVRNHELNRLYADSKVVVGDSVCIGANHENYWSDRVYETIGRGGFLIHPYIKGLDQEFTDGETIVFYKYGDFGGLKDKIDYYLEHDEERERIRLAGHEFVKNNCTYHNRLKDMLEVIGSADGRPTPESALPIMINLGSGNDPLEGHVNVDMLEREDVDVVHNLMDFPYPFPDKSASHIKAIDVIEHLDHYTSDKKPTIMEFMRECHRILQNDGELYIQTPSWDSDLFKIDITHVRGFHPKSFDFFDKDTWYGQIRGFYNGPEFKVSCKELDNGNLQFTMVKR